jgi:glyoxylase-like metal-dependent hydrolase (beta-lactamase superfamily II)
MQGNGMAVAEGVHRLTNGVSNFYLIEENGKLVLVDAGAPKDWARLIRAITALGRAPADLGAVILTHAPGSAALFLESRRVLLTGDSLVTRNPLTGRIGPQIMPAGLNSDSSQALRSLDNLAGSRRMFC